MKKLICLALAMMLVLCVPMVALAESVVQGVDWTPIVVAIIGVIGTVVSALVARVWVTYVKPWIEERNLGDAAKIVVDSVEALLGRYCGSEKWRVAIEKMSERGFDVNSELVIDALMAAWKQLDLEQMLAGEKEKPPEGAVIGDGASE